MKFLADENIANSVVQKLRNPGFDIKDVKENNLRGAADRTLIRIADKEERIIITHDKNFGGVLTQPNIKHKGVLIVRCQHYFNVTEILLKFLNSKLKEKCKNSVVILSKEQTTIYKNPNQN